MLDPTDWAEFRRAAHAALDDTIDDIMTVQDRPVWQPVPTAVKSEIASLPIPYQPVAQTEVYDRYQRLIQPYAVGNRHPRFFGWVHGSGTASGMVAQMLAAGLNANVGGREQAPVYIERALLDWWKQLFGFPPTASGIVTSGTSLATLIAVLVARRWALGENVRERGIDGARLVAYAGRSAHNCVAKALEIAGLGRLALRRIAVDADHRISVAALREQLARDRADGFEPFLLVGTVGTVDLGASDDLQALADLAAAEKLWFHVDGAYGALAILAPEYAAVTSGIERADSLALDFHKWLHAPYGTGMVLVRDGVLHQRTFADQVDYLTVHRAGTAGGEPWFCDFGPELSRGFGALAVWMMMQEPGLEQIGASVAHNCRMAARLGELLTALPDVRLAAPVMLNIVCAQYAPPDVELERLDEFNDAIVVALQERGVAVPSTTRVNGRLVMRFNFTNHRVQAGDLELVQRAIAECINRISKGTAPYRG